MNSRLIELLRETRMKKGLRQKDAADLLGVKHNTLSNWERGRSDIDIDTYISLCNMYGVDAQEF